MSQTIQSPSVTTLAKGLDETSGFDPDETMPFPTAALMAAMAAAAPTEQPPADPMRDSAIGAHMVALRLWREAPLADGVETVGPLSQDSPARVVVMLHRDADRSRMEGFRALYGGEITHCEFADDQNPGCIHSELLLTIDGVAVRVWTLCPIAEQVQA